MNQIFSNKATHSMTCPVCGDSTHQNSCEVWANVPDNEIDFAIENNAKMESDWMDTWIDEVEIFQKKHSKKCEVGVFPNPIW